MGDPPEVTEKRFGFSGFPHTWGVTTTTLTLVPPGTVFPAAMPWATTVFVGSVEVLSRMTAEGTQMRD